MARVFEAMQRVAEHRGWNGGRVFDRTRFLALAIQNDWIVLGAFFSQTFWNVKLNIDIVVKYLRV